MTRRKIDNSGFYNEVYKDYKDNILTIQQIAEKHKIAIKTIYNIKGYIEKDNNIIEDLPVKKKLQSKVVKHNPKLNKSDIYSEELWFGKTYSEKNISENNNKLEQRREIIKFLEELKSQ